MIFDIILSIFTSILKICVNINRVKELTAYIVFYKAKYYKLIKEL